MPTDFQTTIKYDVGGRKDKRSYSFPYTPVPALPTGSSNEEIFRQAIRKWPEGAARLVLSDVYRYLVFSNFAQFNSNLNSRSNSLRQLDVPYPYAHRIAEASAFDSGYYQSHITNITGAVLYLLMQSRKGLKNSDEVNRILGGILVAMLSHRKYKDPPRIVMEP